MLLLQKAIAKEVKDRVDDVRNLQFLTQSAANAMLERLQEDAMHRLTDLAEKFEKLNTRAVTLERGIKQFKGELPSKLLVDTAALMKETSEAKLQVEEMDTVWLMRDSEIERRIAQVESDLHQSMSHMLSAIEGHMVAISQECEQLCKPQDHSQEEKFREFVLEEFATVKSAVTLESEARQKSDEEILEAIQYYSEALRRHIIK
jgi:hypothetical protein